MNTPLSTPIRHAKLGISSTKSLPLANEYKKLLAEQYQRLWLKHQQDLDLIDDIRSYVKSRLSIEREYTQALSKLSRQHISHINKRFTLLQQCDSAPQPAATTTDSAANGDGNGGGTVSQQQQMINIENEASDSRLQKRLANNGLEEPDQVCTLYKVWSEHINRLQSSSKNRADQFDQQLTMVVDKLKDIRSHKANIGKKCLDSHLRRIHEDVLVSMVDVEKARKLYHEDESQAKKARENEEKIKKKRSGLLTKFTGGDLQAKKEKTSAQREANDIQSTQARNDYIMALAAANAHLQHYYVKDLSDFMNLIDDGVLDHCKIFMATLSECDINSLKDSLHHAQYWSKMINLTGSQKTNAIFLECELSSCLKNHTSLAYEACNNDPVSSISLEHNADYALQHEIDKWFTWFKKECRNLSQLIHQLERCQRALAEGQKSIELNGQTVEDLEPKIIDLKQQIRKSEAAKLKAQARLKVIREGGMQIEEWGVVESEIRADMLRAQEELDSKRLRDVTTRRSSSDDGGDPMDEPTTVKHHVINNDQQNSGGGGSSSGGGGGGGGGGLAGGSNSSNNNNNNNNNNNQPGGAARVLLQVSRDSDGSDMDESMHNLASVSRSTSNLMDKQQKAISGYSALTDPSLVWQDDYSGAWNAPAPAGAAATPAAAAAPVDIKSPTTNHHHHHHRDDDDQQQASSAQANRYNHLETSSAAGAGNAGGANNTVQSSSPLSAIMDGNHGLSTSPYNAMGEAYKSDYECDYNRSTGPHCNINSAASSAEPYGGNQYNQTTDFHQEIISEQVDEGGRTGDGLCQQQDNQSHEQEDVAKMLGQQVIAQYTFDKTNEDDLSFVEGDILRVIEISDSNWLQARNEATGEQGFIPAPYVKLLPPSSGQQQQQHHRPDDNLKQGDDNRTEYEIGASLVEDRSTNDGQFVEGDGEDSEDFRGCEVDNDGPVYCRALYDYQPEANTYEPDGLPHLALKQGETLRVLDQGQEDGWLMVEKEDSTRGHVPSMLVEELDGQEGDQGGDDDDEDVEVSADECSTDYPDFGAPPPPMPNVEPPKLDLDHDDNYDNRQAEEDSTEQQSVTDQQQKPTSEPSQPQIPATSSEPGQSNKASSSLVPTSFIIIEPTPEVESRSIESRLAAEAAGEEAGIDGDYQQQQQQQQEPAKGYSVINEDFVLEGPTRKPSQLNETNTNNNNSNYEPLSECDDSDIPNPPSVVIESFEVEKHDSSSSSEAGEDAGQTSSQHDSEHNQQPTREIRHTGNVDVNPILRHRAEEFTKQIIAEAIAMTPKVTASRNSNDSEGYENQNNYSPHYNDYNARDDLDEEEEGNQ